MATTITGKLNKAASEFQAGESIGFGLRLGVQYYDRETKSKEWTNYEAVIFAKASAQIDFYRSVLVEGAIVEVSAPQQKIRVFQGNNGPINSIELLNAQLGYAFSPNSQQAPPQDAPKQARHPQGQQQPAPGGFDDFDDEDIPF